MLEIVNGRRDERTLLLRRAFATVHIAHGNLFLLGCGSCDECLPGSAGPSEKEWGTFGSQSAASFLRRPRSFLNAYTANTSDANDTNASIQVMSSMGMSLTK